MSEPEPSLPPLPDLHGLIGREREAMADELLRARELLRDGMAKLAGFFDVLRAGVDVQTALLAKLSDDKLPADERRATLLQLFADHERVLSQSETAILGLQLEDVLGQLLEYTRKRAESLATVADALADAADRETLARNSALQKRLQEAVAQVDQRAGSRVVEQDSLSSGEIELF